MLKAVLRKGAIVPLEPLPADWEDGVALEVAKTESDTVDIDAWAKMMNEVCADSSAEEEERMQAAIDEHRRQAKAQTRHEMGLP
jgi:hypothetical protein